MLAETLAGSRPQKQLAPWTTEQARKRIGQLTATLATAHQPRLKRVIVRSPADGVVEMTVIVWLGTRACALAVRLERDHPADPPEPTDPGAAAAAATTGPVWAPGSARPVTGLARLNATRLNGAQPSGARLNGARPSGARPSGPESPRAQPARWYCTAIEAA